MPDADMRDFKKFRANVLSKNKAWISKTIFAPEFIFQFHFHTNFLHYAPIMMLLYLIAEETEWLTEGYVVLQRQNLGQDFLLIAGVLAIGAGKALPVSDSSQGRSLLKRCGLGYFVNEAEAQASSQVALIQLGEG